MREPRKHVAEDLSRVLRASGKVMEGSAAGVVPALEPVPDVEGPDGAGAAPEGVGLEVTGATALASFLTHEAIGRIAVKSSGCCVLQSVGPTLVRPISTRVPLAP
jgi:hypothetical protein